MNPKNLIIVAILILMQSCSVLKPSKYVNVSKEDRIIYPIINKKCQVVEANYISNADTINFLERINKENFTIVFFKMPNDNLAFSSGHYPDSTVIGGEIFYKETSQSKKGSLDFYKGRIGFVIKEDVMQTDILIGSYMNNGELYYAIIFYFVDDAEMKIVFRNKY